MGPWGKWEEKGVGTGFSRWCKAGEVVKKCTTLQNNLHRQQKGQNGNGIKGMKSGPSVSVCLLCHLYFMQGI